MDYGCQSTICHQPLAISHDKPRSLGAGARPDRALILALRDAVHALVQEPLQAPPVVGLGRVEVALRVGGDAVHGVELPGLLAAVAEARQDFERLPIENPDALVFAVGEVD